MEQLERAEIHYTYNDFLRDILVIADQIQRHNEFDDFRPAAIFCLARGGLVPASYLAHRLGTKQVAEVDTFLGDTPKRLLPQALSQEHHYLLVDDISDTGHTLTITRDALEAKCKENGWRAEIRTVTLWVRDTTTFIPDHFGRIVHGDAWINFPWEADLKHGEIGHVIEIMGPKHLLYEPPRYIAIIPSPVQGTDSGADLSPTIATTDTPEKASIFENTNELHIALEELLANSNNHPNIFSQGTLIQSSTTYDKKRHAKYWSTFKA